MNGLPYYKAYPRDFFEGTRGMSLDLKGSYRLVLDLIYMHGGKLYDDPRFISGQLGCSVKKWNLTRASLIEIGKLSVSGEFLANLRADKELEMLRRFQDKQTENASGPRKNKGLDEATAKPNASHTEPEPEPYKKEKKEVGLSPPKMRLPEDWALSDEGWEYARSQNIPDNIISDEAKGFHAYWTDRRDRDATKSARGWEQCWANRCRQIAPKYARGSMAGGTRAFGGGSSPSIASIVAQRRAAGVV